MYGEIIAAVVALVVAAGGYLLVRYRCWDSIRDQLAGWLRASGLDRSMLMDALVRLDNLVVNVRCRLIGKTRHQGEVLIREEILSPDDIDDPEVLAELRKRGHFEKSVLTLIEGG
jgi:hypothetical protein